MIDREALVKRHHPILNKIIYESPFSVGNGEFAYTVDVTGFQSLYDAYVRGGFPLCTMSQWGWHEIPVSKVKVAYTWDDLILTTYQFVDRMVTYPVDRKEGNEDVYAWLRENPHRFNLAAIGLMMDDKKPEAKQITNIRQELKLYEGLIDSYYQLEGVDCSVKTMVDPKSDTIAWKIKSQLIQDKRLKLSIRFPYGASDITGSNWDLVDKHQTEIMNRCQGVTFKRTLDKTLYYLHLYIDAPFKLTHVDTHTYIIEFDDNEVSMTAEFITKERPVKRSCEQVFKNNELFWKKYWQTVGMADFTGSKDPRASELERRILLSQYITTIQNTGSMPPQESGLSCNTWYGKFHLEMHLWHNAHLPLWNQSALLKRVLPWYHKNLDLARKNAQRNQYRGVRWAKMTGSDGIDSPSPIAPLLIWQQPHIIYMLELLYQQDFKDGFLKKHWQLVKETTEFMVDFLQIGVDGNYHQFAPIIPAQERFNGGETNDPTFELEYWRFNLKIAVAWAKRLDEPFEHWEDVLNHMVASEVKDGLLLAHRGCYDTYTNSRYLTDHPSVVGAYGLIPNDRIDPQIFKNTLDIIYKKWDFKTMWGWDFAMMAMTETRLGNPNRAIDILLMDTYKNKYYPNGHNYQLSRADLPVYLPGNGSLLLAAAMMIGGYKGAKEKMPGIPKDGMWQVTFENIFEMPF